MSQIRSDAQRLPPQFSRTPGISSLMLDVIIALLPSLGMAVYLFGPRVLILAAISVLSCTGSELLYQMLTHRPLTLNDLSACVTGLMLAMCMPATAPYWAPVIGGVFAIVVVKQFYGGLGRNFMNPALAGRMLLTTFPFLMTRWSDPLHSVSIIDAVDVITAATPMAYLHEGLMPPHRLGQLLLGQQSGSLGEVSVFMLLLGGAYLLLRRVISPRIPAAFLGTVAALSLLFPQGNPPVRWTLVQLFSGGLIFGAVFMATDHTTNPVTPRGQVFFGVGCGLLTVLLRRYGSYPEGVGWAILTMNCCVWLLDRAGLPRRFGVKPFTATRRRLKQIRQNLSQIKFVRPKLRLAKPDGSIPGEAHLDQIRAWGKSALVLGGLLLTVCLIVSGLSMLTSLDTARGEVVAQQALLKQVMPQADIRTETPYRSPHALSITAGYNEAGLVGYCVELQTYGFGGAMTMVVGVDLNGAVSGVAVTDHSETIGMGTDALADDYLDRYIGKSGTIRASGRNAVDVLAGSTVTSKAVTSGVNRALAIVTELDTQSDVNYTDGDV